MSKEPRLGSQPEGTTPSLHRCHSRIWKGASCLGSQDSADVSAQVGGSAIPFALPAKFPPYTAKDRTLRQGVSGRKASVLTDLLLIWKDALTNLCVLLGLSVLAATRGDGYTGQPQGRDLPHFLSDYLHTKFTFCPMAWLFLIFSFSASVSGIYFLPPKIATCN